MKNIKKYKEFSENKIGDYMIPDYTVKDYTNPDIKAPILEYKYWEIWFTSCEGNKRHTIARTPIDWDDHQVRDRIPIGGCGDDVAEIISIEETGDEDYSWDFCD